MFGKTRHRVPYYACEVDPNEHRERSWFPAHPKSLWIREETLLESVSDFFTTCVFGPNRRVHLDAALRASQPRDASDRISNERHALEQAISAIDRRQDRLIQTLAEGIGGDGPGEGLDPELEKAFRDGIRKEHAHLGRQRKALSEQLGRMDAPEPSGRVGDAALLDALPMLNVDVRRLPEEKQRQLYEAFGLEVRYSRPREDVSLRVTIAGHLVHELRDVADGLQTGHPKSNSSVEAGSHGYSTQSGKSGYDAPFRSHVLGAPGRIRTCAHGSGGRCSIP